jgi:hypothetical protein
MTSHLVSSCACTAATTRQNVCPARATTAIIAVRHVANTASQEPKNALRRRHCRSKKGSDRHRCQWAALVRVTDSNAAEFGCSDARHACRTLAAFACILQSRHMA